MRAARTSLMLTVLSLGFAFTIISGCQREEFNRLSAEHAGHSDEIQDDFESEPQVDQEASCKKATSSQIARVNEGAAKKDRFLAQCYAQTNSKKWCDQIVRPNPESSGSFDCTYSTSQAHVFVHPDESTWVNAISAVKIVQGFEAKGIKVQTIYNWWRPEPYNANVGGAAGRHPYGTSVDVRFPTKAEQNRAFKELCALRAQGKVRAAGYYSGTGLHFGVGDKTANTWGKSCS
jgi:hypothetical protein